MPPSTFSIVAVDPKANEVGVAVQSKFLCVGAVVPWVRGAVGAVATQASTDTSFGPRALDMLETGMTPRAIVEALLASDTDTTGRQFAVVDMQGRSASHTAAGCFEFAASRTGEGYACQGNILASAEVVPAMAAAFEASAGARLAERMLAALFAGQAAGGDRRGQESAALVIARPGGGYGGKNDRYIDLRVDHHDTPIQELAALLDLHRLYFKRSAPGEILTVDAEMEAEIGGWLWKLDKWPANTSLWTALENYMAWENLEERWVGPGKIDYHVRAYLRDHALRHGH
ncbi:MAG: DUF1028 domain-containing protein [Anaerolineae bacterium]|nr:DUF1028 domain-containing protein [Anaerolineae bacterium]